jgi:fibro-slime domain-containing protein
MRFVSAVTSMVLLSTGFAWSQTVYPPTIRIPVTFYDFHADGSNPDFEPGLNSCGSTGCLSGTGLHLNEVQTTLDAQRKPILGTSPYFSQRVTKWFRPWQAGDFAVPGYSAAGAYLHDSTLTTDTAYKNMVFPDTLAFTLVPGSAGVYQFSNNAFFRLDGKGFGNEPAGNAHNFSFTMELHFEFTYQSGLTYNFAGDDDVWVFINGKRVIDLGGIHSPLTASVNLDNLTGMTIGQRYMFDVFYVERKITGSNIIITTNVISVNPRNWALRLKTESWRDTVSLGDSVALSTVVFDDTLGIHPEMSSQISSLCDWTLSPAGTASSLRNVQGDSNMFYANTPDQTFVIVVKYNGPPDGAFVQRADQCTVYVKPGPVSNRLEQLSVSKALEKTKIIREFYNLRGQRLRGLGNSHVDGIVFERIIGPNGAASVKRKFRGLDSK